MASSRVKIDHAALGRTVQQAARHAREQLGEAILRDSQQLVPYVTGTLHDSGFVESDNEVTRVGYGEFYGRFVEMGTVHMSAQPYLRPAALKYRNLG